MTAVTKVDSNVTGLRYAEEASLGTLPGTPAWNPFEPNSYAEFGGQITTVARNPINPSRQRKKGVVTDLEAGGTFNTDLTQVNLQDILQGFFFASLRKKDELVCADVDGTNEEFDVTCPALSAVVAVGGTTYVVDEIATLTGGTFGIAATFRVTAVTGGVVDTVELVQGGDYTVVPGNPVSTTGGGDGFLTLTVTWEGGEEYVDNDLIFAKGFDDAVNGGLHVVAAAGGTENAIPVDSNLVDATTQTGIVSRVGFEFAAGDAEIDATGTLPILKTTTKDLTELELIVGEWVFLGDDAAANQFATMANNTFARVRSIAVNAIEFDKAGNTLVTDAGAAKTIRVFFGRVLKNESLFANIVRRTYNVERTLGVPDDAEATEIQSEYLVGAIPSEFTLNIPTADKITADLAFMATNDEQRSGVTGVKSGTRPAIVEADAFNTSSDVTRIKMAVVSSLDPAPTALFAYLTELTLTINNNISLNKAVGVLGAFDGSTGNFDVGGSVTAYFADVAAVQSVWNNDDITLDVHLVKANQGITVDIPLITLGDGRPNVEQDQAITLPFGMEAATGAKIDTDLDHTLLMVFWDYLPNLAE